MIVANVYLPTGYEPVQIIKAVAFTDTLVEVLANLEADGYEVTVEAEESER